MEVRGEAPINVLCNKENSKMVTVNSPFHDYCHDVMIIIVIIIIIIIIFTIIIIATIITKWNAGHLKHQWASGCQQS